MDNGFIAFVGLAAMIASGVQLWRKPLYVAHAGLGAGAAAIVYGGGGTFQLSAIIGAVVFATFLGLQIVFGLVGRALDWIVARVRSQP